MDSDKIKQGINLILEGIGEDTAREGLQGRDANGARAKRQDAGSARTIRAAQVRVCLSAQA